LEQRLGTTEPLVTDGDHLSIGQFVRLLQRSRGSGSCHLLLKVQRNVAQLLLDVTHDFPLSGGSERVAPLGQDLHQVVGQIATGQIQTQDGVRESVAFVDGHRVRHTITRVHHNAGGTAGSVQRQHRLDGHIHCRGVERFEHDLRHLLAVRLRVVRGLRQQDRVLFRSHAQLVVERVVPDLLHIVPVRHDAVLDRVLQRQNSALALGLIADVRVLLAHANHHALVTWTSDNRREHGTRRIVPGEPGLAHTGSIVHDQRCNLFVTHVSLHYRSRSPLAEL
uniref:Uncharacterized protein n=1 Tax=Anopheles coluzzii TaxID=1518534 RepID=A0A8W7PLU9_ANOCL